MWILENMEVIVSYLNVIFAITDLSPSYNDTFRDEGILVKYEFSRDQIDRANELSRKRFPKDFMFGASTSAYQTEGGWNEAGRGESVWDYMTHQNPNIILDGTNGDIAADSFHKYKEDIQLVKKLGSKMYKISLSWSRILPTGYNTRINYAGLIYYNDVIDEMLKNGIEPMVTLFHFDLPYNLQQIGGWSNPIMPTLFEDYARIAFIAFADRVKYWITIHEPAALCIYSYGGTFIPAVNQSGYADYLCGHHVLLAHSRVYHMYQRDFGKKAKGHVGIALNLNWYEPMDRNCSKDIAAAERAHIFYNDWFLHPLFCGLSGYPMKMVDMITEMSSFQDVRVRLPRFSETEINQIKNSVDFLGVSYYTTKLVKAFDNRSLDYSFYDDAAIRVTPDSFSPGELWVKNTPRGLGKLLRRITTNYDLPPIFITGNGYADTGKIEDVERAVYIEQHLFEVLQAMREGIDIRGYLVRSLIDSFEWMYGYTVKFGLYHVNFKNETRPRTEKLSAGIVASIYKTREVNFVTNILLNVIQKVFEFKIPYYFKSENFSV